MHCRRFNSVLGLYPLDARGSVSQCDHLLDVIQISPGEQNRPGWRAAEFYDARFSCISVPIIGLLLTTDDLS